MKALSKPKHLPFYTQSPGWLVKDTKPFKMIMVQELVLLLSGIGDALRSTKE